MRIDGTRFTVLGLGILGGGVGVARYLASHGGIVTVTDMRPADQLQTSIDQLQGLPIIYHLGGHLDDDFTRANADAVVRNPGVRRWSPYLKLARENDVRIEMEMSLFFPRCAAPILGITGTKGKTTVSTLIGEIMRTWRDDAILAGNMGVSALAAVDDIQPDQPVAIELSSWQLEALDEHGLAPHVAVITNISPDHLDAYDGYEDYAATKRSIARHQTASDYLVYNGDDADTAKVIDQTEARLLPFGLREPDGDGAWADDTGMSFRFGGTSLDLPLPTQLSLSGEHGLRNALAAGLACLAYGVPVEAVTAGIAGFRGVENRLEELGTAHGVVWVNDTSATAPAAAVHAIDVLSKRANTVHIIAGGADKQTDLTPFADVVAGNNVAVYLLEGTATPAFMRMLDERGVGYAGPFDAMAAAVDAATIIAQPGDAIALVPGCASFGMFRNEFDRGNQFKNAFAAYRETHRD